jgi:hypothetical protein
MTISLIKAAAAAAAITAVSATGAFAFAPLTGTFNYDTQIKASHTFASATVNWADAGDDLTVVSKFGNWLKVKVPGPDGWVKKSAVSLDYYPTPYPTPSPSPVHACFWGPGGYICIN